MFIRLKRVGKYQYLQMVENRRAGDRTSQRVLCKLGRLEELRDSGRIDVLLQSLSRFGKRFGLVEMNKAEASVAVNNRGPDADTQVPPDPISKPRRAPANGSGFQGARSDSNETAHGEKPAALSQSDMIALLREWKLFANLDTDRLVELSRLAAVRRLERGQFLFLEGDPVDSLYVVVSGLLKASRITHSGKEVVGAIFGRGDTVTSIMLFVDEPHLFACQAVRDSRVLQIRKHDLVPFLERYPEVSHSVLMRTLSIGGRRSRNAMRLLIELATERTEYRLSRTLALLYTEYGGTIVFTRRELAELAGTTPETATRFVGRLRERGILQSSRGKLLVLEPEGLGIIVPTSLPEQNPRPALPVVGDGSPRCN